MISEDLQAGKIIGFRYRVVKPLRADGAGHTFLCHDLRNSQSPVTVRFIRVDGDGDNADVQLRTRFSKLSRMQHPGLSRMLDLGTHDARDERFLVEEFVSGRDFLPASEGWTLDQTLRALARICGVLQYLHRQGIAHGSLKPSHVLVVDHQGDSAGVRLVGLQVLPQKFDRVRAAGRGDAAYASPEVLLGEAPSPQSDFYSLGILAYQLLSRRLPFEQGHDGYLVQKQLQGRADMSPIERLKYGPGLSQVLKSLLEKEPGKRPSTADEVIRLFSAASGQDVSHAETSAKAGYFSPGPFVGRDRESQFLQERAERICQTGRGWTVFISGESGSGKSRCMEELRLWALLKNWRVVEGTCRPYEERPYGPYREILQTASVDTLPNADDKGEIFRFSESPQSPRPDSLDPLAESAAGQFRDLLTRELVRRIRGGPTIVLLNDFHWADHATTTVLDYLTSDILVHPVLVCVSFRPSGVGQAPIDGLVEKALRQDRSEILHLETLPENAVEAMIAGMTGDEELGKITAPRVYGATGGNPFFVEEVLKHLVDRGILLRDAKGWHLEQEDLGRLEVPETIAAVLRHRLDSLSPAARNLAGWLALFGRPVSRELLLAATPGRPIALDEPLADLTLKQIIRSNATEGNELYEFRHALISDVIREDLPKSKQRKMHRRIGEVLEQLRPEEVILLELATHFTNGDPDDKAVNYALQAARVCRAEFAHESALRFYEFVLRHGSALSEEQLCQAAIEGAEVCCALGFAKRGVKMLESQLKRAKSISRIETADLLAHLALAYRHSGENTKQANIAKSGLRLLEREDSGESETYCIIRALLLKELAFFECIRSHPKKCSLFLYQALDAIPNRRYGALAAQIYITMSAMSWLSGDVHAALAAAEEAITIVEPSNDVQILPIALSQFGICLTAVGRFGSALPHHRRAVDLSNRTRTITLRAQALTNLAECLSRSGKHQLAVQECELALRFQKESANPSLSHAICSTIAEIKLSAGNYAGAKDLLTSAKESKAASIPVYSRAHSYYINSVISYEIGDYQAALAMLQKLGRLHSNEAPVFQWELGEVLRARILMRRNRLDDAIQLLTTIGQTSLRKNRPYQLCITRLALAEALLERGASVQAGRAIRDSLRLANAMPSIHLQAQAHLLLARRHLLDAGYTDPGCIPDCCSADGKALDLIAAASGELEEASRLAVLSGSDELHWRIQAELAALHAARGDRSAAVRCARLSLEHMARLESFVPEADIESYRAVTERKMVRLRCEQLLQTARTDRSLTDAPASLEGENLRILFRVSSMLSSIRDLDPLLEIITTELEHALKAERVLIYLRAEGADGLRLTKCKTRGDQVVSDIGSGCWAVIEDVHRSGIPFVSTDSSADVRLAGRVLNPGEMPGTIFCAPLSSGGKSLGVIYAEHPDPRALVGESTIDFLAAFCNLAASSIDNALIHGRLVEENLELERLLRDAREGDGEMVGESGAMSRLRSSTRTAAISPMDVLIVGESGTGKELVARALHRMGRRSAGSFISVDCGSLADTLAESEFFGYRKGAFTGAIENRGGLLEAANGGIIFLDEISNLSLKLQGKLLRVLQEREVRRIGETTPRRIDIQVFAATNRNLKLEVEKGRFRKDLYYRLNAMQIRVPALRERMEDVPLLVAWFLEKTIRAEKGQSKGFSREAMDLMLRYSYPGNVRELKNAVQSAYYSCIGQSIRAEHLPPEFREADEEAVAQEDRSARLLYEQIRKGKGTFDNLVKEPFLERRIAQGTVRQLFHIGLTETSGRYRDTFRLFRIPSKEYSVTMNFLKRHGCYLDFRAYRHSKCRQARQA